MPRDKQEGGTYVIPGHGRIADEADVVEYFDMMAILRDRLQDAVKKGMSAGTGEGGRARARLRGPVWRDTRRVDNGRARSRRRIEVSALRRAAPEKARGGESL